MAISDLRQVRSHLDEPKVKQVGLQGMEKMS